MIYIFITHAKLQFIFPKKHAKCKIIYKKQIYKVQPSRKKVTPQTEDQNYTDSFNPKNVLPPPQKKKNMI